MGSMLSRPRPHRDQIVPSITLIITHISHSDITAAVGATRNLQLQDVGSLKAAVESDPTSPTSSASSTSTSTPIQTQTQTPKSTLSANQTSQQSSKQPPKEHFPQIRIYRIKSKSHKSKSREKTNSKPKSNKSSLSNIEVLVIVMPLTVRIHGWTRDSLLVGEVPRLKGFGFRSEKELDYGLLSASEALNSVVSQLDMVIGFERLFSWR